MNRTRSVWYDWRPMEQEWPHAPRTAALLKQLALENGAADWMTQPTEGDAMSLVHLCRQLEMELIALQVVAGMDRE